MFHCDIGQFFFIPSHEKSNTRLPSRLGGRNRLCRHDMRHQLPYYIYEPAIKRDICLSWRYNREKSIGLSFAGICRKNKKMLSDGSSNVYTISKGGVKKLIFQSPWKINGEIAGLVETSMILPPDMPHYDRDSR